MSKARAGSGAADARRLDVALLELGLATSRARARRLIEAGAVRVDGRAAARASETAASTARIEVVAADDPCPWVSRGALKLLHALDAFGLTPEGATVLDIGASTGGFTEVCLARGAARVFALDVGVGQLDPRIAADPRVTELSGRNARDPGALDAVDAPIDWIVADVSFISFAKAATPALAAARPGAALVALVKPQFELGPGVVDKSGVVRDAADRARATSEVAAHLEGVGWSVIGVVESPILGAAGNREALLAARKRAQ